MPTRKATARKLKGQKVPSAAGIGYHLREAYRAFSRDFHARLARHGITHAQWMLLWLLWQAGSLTPLELSRRAGIQKASTTSVIEALKKRKLIRGDQDLVDRDRFAGLFLPLQQGGFGHGFAELGDFDFNDGHELLSSSDAVFCARTM